VKNRLLSLAINIASVSNSADRYRSRGIVDLIENAIVTVSNAVLIVVRQLLGAHGSRLLPKIVDLLPDSLPLRLADLLD
jgi:hypothetical protein